MSHELPADIQYNEDAQLTLLREFQALYSSSQIQSRKTTGKRYYFENSFFTYSDAVFLRCFLAKYLPSKIVEVGSGFSTALILDTVDELNGYCPEITSVEPYPERLLGLLHPEDLPNRKLSLIRAPIQNVSDDVFESLQSGDLLFIDSSHVCKYGSDVWDIIYRVLPLLQSGVYVHFHDIHYNFQYDKTWIDKGWYWNESYILRAFLASNSSWSMILFASHLNTKFSDYVSELIPECSLDSGGSLYLQKL